MTLLTSQFNVDLLQSDPCLFAHEELRQMNKYFLRNRIRVCEKPTQKAYLETMIKEWGSAKLLERLKDQSGEFDQDLLKKALWEVKLYSELKTLAAIFEHQTSGIETS